MKRTNVTANWEPTYAPIISGASSRLIQSDAITISCYENEVPVFVGPELECLYGSVYSSLTQFRLYGGKVDGTNTYVVRKGLDIITVLLFQYDKGNKGKIKVVNEVIRIDEEDIGRFANYIFTAYKQVNIICFKAIQTNIQRSPFPYQRYNCLEDIVLSLPDTAQEYHANLGKNTRRNIKRYGEKLVRSFPSYRYAVYIGNDVDEQHIREIVKLNRARMAGKNKISAIDERETQRIIDLVRACGLVGVVMIDGRVCAGAISYRAGENYFLSVLAHDPQYDEYWLGILCCYHTICECIARGGKEFHFLWGRYDYKFTLLAVQRDLDSLVLYRSHLQRLVNADTVMKTVFNAGVRQANLWLHNAKRQDTFFSRWATKSLNQARSLRRFGDGLVTGRK